MVLFEIFKQKIAKFYKLNPIRVELVYVYGEQKLIEFLNFSSHEEMSLNLYRLLENMQIVIPFLLLIGKIAASHVWNWKLKVVFIGG